MSVHALPQTGAPVRPRHHARTPTGYGKEEIKVLTSSIPSKARGLWKSFSFHKFETKEDFEREVVRHVNTTLARSMYNFDDFAAYHGTALAMRDRLLVAWNETHQAYATKDPKRVYYLSLEFLMGRTLDNAMLNIGMKDVATEGLKELGASNMEDVLEQEPDAALGNGGLGRLAACFLDSLATLSIPSMGYGIRYNYGIFKQQIVDGYQTEFPDYWLTFDNPWEIPRHDVKVSVRFGGWVRQFTDDDGKTRHVWEGGEMVEAVAHDVPIPGYGNRTTNNLRLWSAKPTREFDLEKFNTGDYESSVREQQRAETISAVLYPNDNVEVGKELRLKQQYFWCCASLYDIVRRFKKTKRPWSEFPDQIAIQLNDTHPTLAIVELQRILIDIEELEWDVAWKIVTSTFGYTNHTVLPEALEKWPVPLIQGLLPRHMQIIYDINLFFLQTVEKKFPKDRELLAKVSIIEESNPQSVRMAYLAIIGSKKVNGVAELHSDLIKATIFKDFVKVFGIDKFTNVTNGITPRRWLLAANPALASLIAKQLGGYDYIKDLTKLKKLESLATDKAFQKEWMAIKRACKVHLSFHIKESNGISVNPDALFDIQVKRIHEYKRQNMNIFGVIHRYLQIKAMTPEERKTIVPRVCIFGGKAAPGYYAAKTIIKLVNSVAEVVNNDKDIGDHLKVVFIADYNVSKAEIIVPASDISQHISTAGTEASGTSNMKFTLNGGLILGTVDGANIEITREIGENNIFLFGHLSEDVEDLRHRHMYSGAQMNPELKKVCDELNKGTFGDPDIFSSLIGALKVDWYLVSDDFGSYLDANKLVDEAYKDQDSWAEKYPPPDEDSDSRSILTVANMGFFSSDRAIQTYCDEIWNTEPLVITGDDEA